MLKFNNKVLLKENMLQKDLNTSHVKVQWTIPYLTIILLYNLNTSHVKVQ